MSDDYSSDCSDKSFQPSGSKGRQQSRQDQKRKRRIVMRIEFDDSEDSTSASDRSSDDEDGYAETKQKSRNNGGGGNDLVDDDGPSCSVKLRNRQRNNKINHDNDSNDTDEFQRNAATRRVRREGRRINVLDVGFSDDSTSGSEITHRKKTRGKKYIVSDDDHEIKSPSANIKTKGELQQNNQQNQEEQGFTSDSSSNDLLEKCPICLLTFRQQEIGSPSTCEHVFCANCIEAWSKNVQTCPIDRIEFQRIIVRESYNNRNIVREINVDPNAKKELVLEDELVDAEDVTNCEICNRPDREDVMLLCDHCNHGYHMDCLSPPLSEVPEGSWYCDNCVDSEEEEDDEEEDLNMLYEDIRDMGIPENRLRVREVQQPRILRTRQNERIRAAILRRTRASAARLETTTTTTTTSTTAQRGRPRTTTTTTTTTRRSTANRTRSANGSAVRKTRKRRRRRRARQRTYVVEYDLNNFDEKFAIKTTKKVIRRRRRRRTRTSSTKGKKSSDGVRMTASKRLAEQMGVKPDPTYTSHLSGSSAGLSLFGGANDLEYFSDSDHDGNIESEIRIETGHGTALQTSVRISNYGSQRSRKGLLLGRLQPNHGIREPAVVEQNNSNPDILSSIMDIQDRWHSAARNLESVHINSDGTLNLPSRNEGSSKSNNLNMENKPEKEQAKNGINPGNMTQAPMYSRGGGNTNFNRGGGGGGGYNNRSNNQNNYRGGNSGGNNQYRHSTGGSVGSGGYGGSSANSSGGINFSMVGRGNFNFSNNPNYNVPPTSQNNLSPFQRGFNQRNQNNLRNLNNQQRNSLPFTNNHNENTQQQQQNQNNPFVSMQQTCLPPPSLLLNQQPQANLQTSLNENSLFAGLPPPMNVPPPHLNVAPPVIMTVPPPPAPPSVVIPPPLNSSLYQLNSDYGNNDDDSNCPNFSIYSHESLQVAKSTESYPTSTGALNTSNVAKEDDENEDLVQLDDDDEIPMPPEPNPIENIGSSELYEPENPTEEIDDEIEENLNENNAKKNYQKTVTKDTKGDGDDYGDDDSDDDDNDGKDKKNGDKNSENKVSEKVNDSKKYDDEEETSDNNVENATNKNINEEKDLNNDNDKRSDTVRSPSPAVSEIRLRESETAAANRKGVLELYDDSDWEELDIERSKDNKDAEKPNEREKTSSVENVEKENESEQDRSYTPCLDENNDPEEPEEAEGGSTTPLIKENLAITEESPSKGAKICKNNEDNAASNIENMDTELISDEEDDLDRNNKDRRKRQKSVDKRSDRRENEKIETFKKIGNKQKGRNYRGDKQLISNNKRIDKRRKSSRSPSRSRSRSRSFDSFYSRRGRSRSRSPRFRGRSDRSRSRSRSNNKENQGRWGGNFRDGGRFQRNNMSNQQNRQKRRELPRYDVRNIVGHHSPPKTVIKDRYGRDTSRNRRSSRSLSRGRRGPPPRSPFSRSRSRNRRMSISLSPSPPYSRRRSISPSRLSRQLSPARRRSVSVSRRTPPFRQRTRSPLRVMRSRSISPGLDQRMNIRKVTRHLRGISPPRNRSRGRLRSRSISLSPRYTPRISRSRSKTPRPKGKKKKAKESRKKKSKRRVATMSPSPNRRISRQPDPFDIEKPPKKKRRRSPRAKSPVNDDHGWSPSPSPPPQTIVDNYEYSTDKNVSWTPPMQSPLLEMFPLREVRSVSRSSRKDRNKRSKKKKKSEKRRDGRKEKKRKRRTETPEPAPSKEVFASGNNILVSVSFNKETTTNQQHTQQTIVTLPPNREDLLTNRRTSIDRTTNTSVTTKKRKEKRKKIDTKPVAIIDLERSPFQVEQEPADVIVLTDSEEALEHDQCEHRRDRHRSESCNRDPDSESLPNQRSVAMVGQRGDKSPEHLDTIHEESYELAQTGGPKTPPEPPVVKFNLQTKKQGKVRNALHEEDDDLASDVGLDERQQQQQEGHRSDMETMHVQSSQKIGPNTPPESGPCSPDAYDPFEPTKSPSISPRSPTPPPSRLDVSQNTICVETNGEVGSNQNHLNGVDSEQQRREQQIPGLGGNVAQGASLNPVDLVMALINSKSSINNNQDLANKSNETQHMNNIGGINSHDDPFRDKADEGNAITVLSNLLITSGNIQHIPSISSPTPPTMTKKILPGLPKIGGSVGGSSSSGVNVRNGGTSNNADDSFNMNDIESPYSPGSADYEDLFEPPPDTSGNKKRSKRTSAAAIGGSGKPEVFDNLFGSSSPVGNVRLPLYTPSKKYKLAGATTRKSKIKVGKSNDEGIKIYDDLPNSAVELHVKDKFLRKLNRQERVVEEVKLVLKPRFNKKQITKDDYKEIMRRAVPKICHSKSGEIDPYKIKKLIEAYVKKFRAKHKKLNIVNTGQVSSAVKCAAYLKKL